MIALPTHYTVMLHITIHITNTVYMQLINQFTGESQVWGEEFGACAYVQCNNLVLVSSVKDLSIRLVKRVYCRNWTNLLIVAFSESKGAE